MSNIGQEISSSRTISSGGEKLQSTTTSPSLESLEQDLAKLENNLNETKNNFEKSRFDLITLLGVFVGLITYLGLEIQVFKTIDNPLLIIGTSIFFIASILLFILTINVILKKVETISWRDFFNPLYIILIILFVVSILFILYGYKDYSIHKIPNPRVSITYGN